MDLSFSGAGFMGCYYFGVVDCWLKYIPRQRVNRVAGASAGSLIAAYYLMELPMEPCLRAIIDMTESIRGRKLGVFDRSHQIVDILPKTLDSLFPEDAHKRVSGRLFVCMTRLKDMKKVIVSEFETRQDLIDALNCSCFIPVWSGNHVSTYKGVKHIDGGFSDNLPVFDEYTIRICCFSGPSDISPLDRARDAKLAVNVINTPLYVSFSNMRRVRHALFPPPATFILSLLERGFHDAKNFILDNDLIQCQECYASCRLEDQVVFSKRAPTLTPRASPSPSRNLSRSSSLSQLVNNNFKSDDGMLSIPAAKPNGLSIKNLNDQHKLSRELNRKLLIEKKQQDDNDEYLDIENVNRQLDQDLAKLRHDAPSIIIESQDDIEKQQENKVNETSKMKTKIIDYDITASNNKKRKPALRVNVELANKCSLAGQQKQDETNLPPNVPSELFLQRRRSSLQSDSNQTSINKLPIKDKFTPALQPLPSCPPSPNLNRNCTECFRKRQEARNDHLEDRIRREAAKYIEQQDYDKDQEQDQDQLNPEQSLSSSSSCSDTNSNYNGSAGTGTTRNKRRLKRSLTSPIRWLRQQMNTKTNSYTLTDIQDTSMRHDDDEENCFEDKHITTEHHNNNISNDANNNINDDHQYDEHIRQFEQRPNTLTAAAAAAAACP